MRADTQIITFDNTKPSSALPSVTMKSEGMTLAGDKVPASAAPTATR